VTLFERVQQHLAASKNNRVVIQTPMRATAFAPKHADMLKPGEGDEPGIYMQSGRKWLYVMPEYVRFARMQ
jgi:molybdopterin-biosynthesis enzyme MoeA-like protein